MAAEFDKKKDGKRTGRWPRISPEQRLQTKSNGDSSSGTPLFLQRSLASPTAPMNGEAIAEPAQTATTAEPAADAADLSNAPGRILIVEDSVEELEAGQLRRSEFLALLRAEVSSAAEDALSGTIWSTLGCPWVDRWFNYYGERSSSQIERAIYRYAPEANGVATADDLIPIICGRVRDAITIWSTTGEMTPDVPTDLPAAAGAGAEGGDSPSETGSVFRKEREGASRESNSPGVMQGELGSGSPLDAGVRSDIESAYGEDFSHVRVHTGASAASASESLNARAFTVGKDIAFGANEYQPGTPIGDALIAHELAHVKQQRSGVASEMPAQKGATEDGSLEKDADQAAVGAVVSRWGATNRWLAGMGQNAMPRLKSGLKLQRCRKGHSLPESAFGPEPNYDLFSQPDGFVAPEQETALISMIGNADQLERVYQDAGHGNERAAGVVEQLETTFAAAGTAIAEQSYSARCSVPVVRELSGDCVPNWSFVDSLSKSRAGGIRLREVIGAAYAERARELGIRNAIIGNALNLLLAGLAARTVLLAGETRAATAGETSGMRGGTRPVIAGEIVAGSAGSRVGAGAAAGRVEAGSLEASLPPASVAGRPPQQVLVVGAEQAEEFAYASEVASRGHRATVVNFVATAEARAFAERGGNFVEGRIESLPRDPVYNIIREDFPFPLGRMFPATETFAAERLTRLALGGHWIVVTEASEFVTTLEAAASRPGFRVTVREVPIAHEATPQSTYAREPRRFIVDVEKTNSP